MNDTKTYNFIVFQNGIQYGVEINSESAESAIELLLSWYPSERGWDFIQLN